MKTEKNNISYSVCPDKVKIKWNKTAQYADATFIFVYNIDRTLRALLLVKNPCFNFRA